MDSWLVCTYSVRIQYNATWRVLCWSSQIESKAEYVHIYVCYSLASLSAYAASVPFSVSFCSKKKKKKVLRHTYMKISTKEAFLVLFCSFTKSPATWQTSSSDTCSQTPFCTLLPSSFPSSPWVAGWQQGRGPSSNSKSTAQHRAMLPPQTYSLDTSPAKTPTLLESCALYRRCYVSCVE